MSARRSAPCVAVSAIALCIMLAVSGCIRAPARGSQDARWSSRATEVPQPARWPPQDYVEGLAPTRALVRSYLSAAAAGDRAAMTAAYLEETRRTAETVVARDLELAREAGPYAQGPTVTTSVFLFEGELFPPSGDFTVEEEDVARLRELRAVHEDAVIVMARFADGSWRAFFVVKDADELRLVP